MAKKPFHPIQKRHGKYDVIARRSGRVLGEHRTRGAALAQLRAVQRSMHLRHNPGDDTYNGWANYETWNVALWIGNDEGLYRSAVDFMRRYTGDNPYEDFIRAEEDFMGRETPDGVRWLDRRLDYDELNTMMEEFA